MQTATNAPVPAVDRWMRDLICGTLMILVVAILTVTVTILDLPGLVRFLILCIPLLVAFVIIIIIAIYCCTRQREVVHIPYISRVPYTPRLHRVMIAQHLPEVPEEPEVPDEK
jgi:hypothetical protein